MKLENLKEGQMIKNYKVLCEILEWEVSFGNTKKKQLRILSEICNYEKQGNKYIIKEIYNNKEVCMDMRGKQDNNTAKYVENIELNIIGELLTKGHDSKYVVGRGVLLRNVGLTNTNYSYCKRRQDKLASYLEIKKELVNDYYNCVDSMLLGNLEKALKNLSNKKLIQLNSTLLICKNVLTNVTYQHITEIDEFDEEIEIIKPVVQSDVIYVQATDEERHLINIIEKRTLTEMGFEKLTDVFLRNKLKEYYNKCYKELRKEIKDLNFYFQAYDIVYDFDILANELEKRGYDDWSKELKEQQSNIINNGAMDRIISNAEKRKDKATPDIGILLESDKKYIRTQDSYIDSYSKLNNNVINNKAKNIKDKIKKIKKLNV
jgi:hypothetical protein